MKRYNHAMTVLMISLVAFFAVLFLYLFTDYKIWTLQDRMGDKFLSIVHQAEDQVWNPQYSEDMDEERLQELYHDFLKEISANVNAENAILFYGNMAYTDGSFVMRNGSKEPDTTNDRLVEVPGQNALGMSDKAREILEEACGSNVANILWRNYPGKLFSVDALNSYWINLKMIDENYQYRMVFVYNPLKMVFLENLAFYAMFPFGAIVLEWAALGILKKWRRRDKNKKMMASTLTTGFSHELKTPLAILRLVVENWDYIEEEDKPQYLEKITAEMNQLDDIVKKVIDISKVQSGDLGSKKETVDLYSFAQEALDKQKAVIDDKNLNVTLTSNAPEECLVEGNPDMLRIAVHNFVSNAVKYSQGAVKVEIISGEKVLFQVSNDGMGLSKEAAPKVWDLFYKGDAARTNRLEGSGVGLAVTKTFLKAHKAKFGCKPGDKMTIFWFEMKQAKRKEMNR